MGEGLGTKLVVRCPPLLNGVAHSSSPPPPSEAGVHGQSGTSATGSAGGGSQETADVQDRVWQLVGPSPLHGEGEGEGLGEGKGGGGGIGMCDSVSSSLSPGLLLGAQD